MNDAENRYLMQLYTIERSARANCLWNTMHDCYSGTTNLYRVLFFLANHEHFQYQLIVQTLLVIFSLISGCRIRSQRGALFKRVIR